MAACNEPYAYYREELREKCKEHVQCGGCESVMGIEHVIESNPIEETGQTIQCPSCDGYWEMYWID